MILITKLEREALDKAGILQYRRKLKGGHFTDANFVVMNKRGKSSSKKIYVDEYPEILQFLGKYDSLNLQIITPEQLSKLKESNLVSDKDIQNWREFVPEATVFVDSQGTVRIKKITAYMKQLGYWK